MLDYHFGYGRYPANRRGKRLRPQLVLRVAADLGADAARALDAAAAVEILHNYSLVHDDIEDRDELRHGRPTLWAQFGVAQALNAGDAMCAISFLTLARAHAELASQSVLHMIVALHRAHRVMCDGQAADLRFEGEPLVGLAEYEAMIAAKTAALFGAACELGAYCGGADGDAAAGYRELGAAFGMAFQIRDDVLGIWASADATGKTAANDIARRKWTFPVVWALGQEPGTARSAVASAYAGGGPIPADAAARVVAALEELGAREAARRAIAEHLGRIERYASGAVGDFLRESLA
ncbi:MAG TPA: polyprenyl synthetase family protein [Candidatus Baltobacteraceae bacterium]